MVHDTMLTAAVHSSLVNVLALCLVLACAGRAVHNFEISPESNLNASSALLSLLAQVLSDIVICSVGLNVKYQQTQNCAEPAS